MKLTNLLTKQPPPGGVERLIRDEMMFLMERNERRFAKQLFAHLLDEGCNLPIVIAKPRFYDLMIAGLFAKARPSIQDKFVQKLPSLQEIVVPVQPKRGSITHGEFFDAMLFFESHLNFAGKQMAIEVTKSLDTIKEAWQLDDLLFQEELDRFETRLQAMIGQICQGVQDSSCQGVQNSFCEGVQTSACNMSLELVRRRLYIALTTSLLRYLGERKPFQAEFSSIPEVVNAMQKDHAVFCRFMAFCKAKTPYFNYIASRTFWRTLETLRLEGSRQ